MGDRDWMSCNRMTTLYRNGVDEFLSFAMKHIEDNRDAIRCPCINCRNHRYFSRDVVKAHLIANGTMNRIKYSISTVK